MLFNQTQMKLQSYQNIQKHAFWYELITSTASDTPTSSDHHHHHAPTRSDISIVPLPSCPLLVPPAL